VVFRLGNTKIPAAMDHAVGANRTYLLTSPARLRRAWPDRLHARSADQREPVLYALTTCGDWRLAHTSLDREDGVRGTRRHRADVRLRQETARSARSGLLTMSSMPLRITGRPRHRHAVIAHGAARAASGHAAAAPPRSAMRSRRGGLKAEHRFWLWFSVAPCSFQCRGIRSSFAGFSFSARF